MSTPDEVCIVTARGPSPFVSDHRPQAEALFSRHQELTALMDEDAETAAVIELEIRAADRAKKLEKAKLAAALAPVSSRYDADGRPNTVRQ